jgi:hypothetical protein
MKFEAVHRKTTRRSNNRPNVWRASPTNFGFGLADPFEEVAEGIEDLDVCNSSGGPEKWLEEEPCLRPLRRGRSPALIVAQNEIRRTYIVPRLSRDTRSRMFVCGSLSGQKRRSSERYGKENLDAHGQIAPIN